MNNMKIVINRQFGGFGLSSLAKKELVKRGAACIESYTPKHYYGGDNTKHKRSAEWEAKWNEDFPSEYEDIGDGFMGHKHGYHVYKDGLIYDVKDRSKETRCDPDVVAVVEELKEKSFGWCSSLSIVEVPDDVNWEIDEYDGMESIHEVHRTWS